MTAHMQIVRACVDHGSKTRVYSVKSGDGNFEGVDISLEIPPYTTGEIWVKADLDSRRLRIDASRDTAPCRKEEYAAASAAMHSQSNEQGTMTWVAGPSHTQLQVLTTQLHDGRFECRIEAPEVEVSAAQDVSGLMNLTGFGLDETDHDLAYDACCFWDEEDVVNVLPVTEGSLEKECIELHESFDGFDTSCTRIILFDVERGYVRAFSCDGTPMRFDLGLRFILQTYIDEQEICRDCLPSLFDLRFKDNDLGVDIKEFDGKQWLVTAVDLKADIKISLY